jgi:hypothetical protein
LTTNYLNIVCYPNPLVSKYLVSVRDRMLNFTLLTICSIAAAMRLVTYADIDLNPSEPPEHVSIAACHLLELDDGQQVLLLDDRGWGSGAAWTETSVETVRENARMVVGPDEPPPGRSREAEADLHWSYLRKLAELQGIKIDADELRQLPHDVVIRPRLLARISGGSGIKAG